MYFISQMLCCKLKLAVKMSELVTCVNSGAVVTFGYKI